MIFPAATLQVIGVSTVNATGFLEEVLAVSFTPVAPRYSLAGGANLMTFFSPKAVIG
jgi:hypothetical protein